jgi:hypothetical protein
MNGVGGTRNNLRKNKKWDGFLRGIVQKLDHEKDLI